MADCVSVQTPPRISQSGQPCYGCGLVRRGSSSTAYARVPHSTSECWTNWSEIPNLFFSPRRGLIYIL